MLRFLFRLVFYVLLLCVVASIGFALLVVERAPVVADRGPPTSEDVQTARKFVRAVYAAGDNQGAAEPLDVTASELNQIIKLGARFLPGFRGALSVEGQSVVGTASVPVPFTNIAVSQPAQASAWQQRCS